MTQEAKTENLMTWNGLDVDFWGPRQTLSPKPIEDVWFAGNWYVSMNTHWSDLIQEIPLDIRYQSFTKRLDKALGRVV